MEDKRLIRKRLAEYGMSDVVTAEKLEMILKSFPDKPADRSNIRLARSLEKKTVRLYRFLPHRTYVETKLRGRTRTLDQIYSTSFSHKKDRMVECGRISLTSEKRRG